MTEPETDQQSRLPPGVILDKSPPFVPRMVMTTALVSVLRDVVHQWKHREKFEELVKYGIRPLDRLLFFGPPGNGKTLACYWIAQQLKIPLYRVMCSQLRGQYLGQTTQAIDKAVRFLDAQTKPGICLWDEVESIFVDRSQAVGQCDREIASALTVFMQAIDRWKSPMLLVLATNLPGNLDAALMSRVAMRLEFLGPSVEQAEQCLHYWMELLTKYGADEWGPRLLERVQHSPPESFRELQQAIAFAAREWVVKQL